jgi:hypothetical protein
MIHPSTFPLTSQQKEDAKSDWLKPLLIFRNVSSSSVSFSEWQPQRKRHFYSLTRPHRLRLIRLSAQLVPDPFFGDKAAGVWSEPLSFTSAEVKKGEDIVPLLHTASVGQDYYTLTLTRFKYCYKMFHCYFTTVKWTVYCYSFLMYASSSLPLIWRLTGTSSFSNPWPNIN